MVTHDNFTLLNSVDADADSLLLLGSQTMNTATTQGVQAAKHLGCDDLDIDGKATIEFDLSNYSAKSQFGTYATIADFGTLEHVDGIANALRNVFAWLEVGGKAIHVNPTVNYRDVAHKDCPKFTIQFWEAYAKLTNMTVELIDYKPAYAMSEAIECRVILEKTDKSKLPTKAKIDALIKKHLK